MTATFTHPDVYTVGVAQGWAEPETDPTRIDWRVRQATALIPFAVAEGRPVSPGPPAAIRHGRNGLGRWGENAMADAIVTLTHRGYRYLLMVERGDGAGWAVPGGSIDPGETSLHASIRELREETGLDLAMYVWMAGTPRYVPDPRGSDEAWAVTVANRVDLGDVDWFPAVEGADDARRAAWVPARDYDTLVPSRQRCSHSCERTPVVDRAGPVGVDLRTPRQGPAVPHHRSEGDAVSDDSEAQRGAKQ